MSDVRSANRNPTRGSSTEKPAEAGHSLCAAELWLSELFLSRYDIKLAICKLNELFV
jgi:hypothetical protein